MKRLTIIAIIAILPVYGCIQDDFVNDLVDPVLRITTTVDTIAISSTFQFESMYLNNVGAQEEVVVEWNSSQPTVISIMNDGLAQPLNFGGSIISVEYTSGAIVLRDSIDVQVGTTTVSMQEQRTGTIASTSSYTLRGDFVLTEDSNNLILEFGSDYKASTALPGLYVYLTNNRNSTASAFEIGAVQVFSGAHTYTIPNVGINDFNVVLYFCRPFNVKVGDGDIL